MNKYRQLVDYLPEFLKKDLFFNNSFLGDNALNMYATEYETNKRKSSSDNLFRNIHRLIKAIILLGNFVDRKIARCQYKLTGQKSAKNPNISRNKILKDKHKNQRCFILANGPSLAKQDLAPLANEITIATNTFWKHPILSPEWQPTYYSAAHFESFYDEPTNREGFSSPNFEEILNYYRQAAQKMPKAINVVPLSGLMANEKYNFFPKEQTYGYPILSYPAFEFLPEFPDLAVGLPWAQDSSHYAIMLAMYMGCNPIILLGCDHDWYVNLGEEKRFFEEVIFEGKEETDSTKVPMLENMWYAWVLWRCHENLKQMAKKHGIEIINATGGGVLDVYPVAKYEDLIKK